LFELELGRERGNSRLLVQVLHECDSITSNNESLTRTYDILSSLKEQLGIFCHIRTSFTRLNRLGYIPLAEWADPADSVCGIHLLMFLK
jgi:hypothetical protein